MRRATVWVALFLAAVMALLGSTSGSLLGGPVAVMSFLLVSGMALLWVLVVVFLAFPNWLDGPMPTATREPRRRP